MYRGLYFAHLWAERFTAIFASEIVVAACKNHRAAWLVFGRAVREEAAAHRWRYEIIASPDEGMLLYLERTHFIEPDEAIREWNRDALNALVAPTDEAPRLMRELSNASLSPIRPMERKNEQDIGYVLLTR